MKLAPITADFGQFVYPEAGETLADVRTEWLREHLAAPKGGLLMFRGFSAEQTSFVRFTESFGQGFLVHHNGDGRDYIDGDRTLATVAKSNKPIDFHIEMASNPVKPDVLWFFCLAPALRKGRIGFVDGRVVLANLTSRTRAEIQSKKLRYEFRNLPPEIWRPVWNKLVGERARSPRRILGLIGQFGSHYGVDCAAIVDDQLSFDYTVEAIYRAPLCGEEVFACGLLDNPRRTLMGDGSAVERAVLIEVAQATYQNAVWFDWQVGDLAVVDNTRVMHSREAFEDTQRKVLVRYSALR
jgi:alpha-ketoglutarate-dependent taurine dioxygenase